MKTMDFTPNEQYPDRSGSFLKAPDSQPSIRTLLVIGPTGLFAEEQARKRGLTLKSVESYVQARYWLEKSVRDELPYAIICELDLSRAGDYSLVEVIREHSVLRRVPFIVVSPESRPIDHEMALKKMMYFLAHIREKYHIDTKNIAPEFYRILALKSGVDEKVIVDLFGYYHKIQRHEKMSNARFLEFNKLLQHFKEKENERI